MANARTTPEYRAYKKALDRIGDDVLPRIIAETVNIVAGYAHVQSIKNTKSRMTLRNQYTTNSIRFYKANPKKDTSKINAVTGSIQPYMALQETGGYKRPRKGKTLMEPTLAARGGNSQSVVKRRFVTVGSKMPKSGPKMFIGNPRGIRRAGKFAGRLLPYGMYSRNRGNTQLTMIRNISTASRAIDSTNWHTDAVKSWGKRDIMMQTFKKLADAEIAKAKAKNS